MNGLLTVVTPLASVDADSRVCLTLLDRRVTCLTLCSAATGEAVVQGTDGRNPALILRQLVVQAGELMPRRLDCRVTNDSLVTDP